MARERPDLLQTLFHKVNSQGLLLTSLAVEMHTLSTFGNKYSAVVEQWLSWPAQIRVIMQFCSLVLVGSFDCMCQHDFSIKSDVLASQCQKQPQTGW